MALNRDESRNMPSASNGKACAGCAVTSPDLLVVRRRQLCHECFAQYVASRIRRRMEPYKSSHQVDEQPPKLLLPLSGGVSSLTLLHVLDAQVKKHMKNRRLAYHLVLVYVELDDKDEEIRCWRESVRQGFANHEFLPRLKLQDVFDYDPEVEQDLQNLELIRTQGEDNATLMTRLFTAARTATARSDLQELLLQRLIVAIAKKYDCGTILWGHSDSRLAAKALADVAKGRGGSVPNATSDGPSPWSVNFIYLARELYKAELESYVQIQPDLRSCLKIEDGPVVPASIRNTSIDELLKGYITSQGEKYPGVMANVVRTAAKLQVPSAGSFEKCGLCSMPVTRDREGKQLCYGCERMRQDIKV